MCTTDGVGLKTGSSKATEIKQDYWDTVSRCGKPQENGNS